MSVRVPAGTTYRVIDSDFEPADPDLKAFFVDGFKDDVVFKGPNDGMVAIDSIEGKPLQKPFPVLEPCTFARPTASSTPTTSARRGPAARCWTG